MMGLYIHIPFCDKACHYCDFHFSTSFDVYRTQLVDAIILEMDMRKEEVGCPSTIYFGGGTPSILNAQELDRIFDFFRKNDWLDALRELTFEVNPDHLTEEYLDKLKSLGVTRLSIGVQSFHNDVLQKLNRNHSREKALEGLTLARKKGFKSLTLDLIYGIPFQNTAQLKENLEILHQLKTTHISAYQLTIEENTVFGNWKKKGKLIELEDEEALNQFKMVRTFLLNKGYIQYEVSNFALPGYEAVHNASYWKKTPYVGIGPSAHSFDGANRSWNIANNSKYIENINAGFRPFEKEKLSKKDEFNESVMLGLRQLKVGLNLKSLQAIYNQNIDGFLGKVESLESQGMIEREGENIKVSEKGIFVIDWITSELMV